MSPATREQVEWVLANVRPVSGSSDSKLILEVFERSFESYAIGGPEGVLVVFGLTQRANFFEPVGIWMISSKYALKHKIPLLRLARGFIEVFLEDHGGLFGFTVEGAPWLWLEKMGFRVEPEINGYRRFEKWLSSPL